MDRIKSSLPSLLKGDKISYFAIEGTDGMNLDRSVLDKNKFSTILIFQRPCSPCNKNITIWNRLAVSLRDKANIYGIVLDKIEETSRFAQAGLTKFKLYSPQNIETFIQSFNIQINLPQTILYEDGKIVYIKLGDLLPEDYFEIMKIIKGEAK